MSNEPGLSTPLLRWLRSARTRRQVAKALGEGDDSNDTYQRMASGVLNFLWSDALNEPHTDPTAERSAGAAPLDALDVLDVLDRIRLQIPNPPPHQHDLGCGHNGEGIHSEYQRGFAYGCQYDNEQVRIILDDLAAEYARLAEGTDR